MSLHVGFLIEGPVTNGAQPGLESGVSKLMSFQVMFLQRNDSFFSSSNYKDLQEQPRRISQH